MQVVYEDNHLIAINKNANELVHGDRTGDTSLDDMVKAYIKEKYNKPGDVFLGVVHRLDRPTSGVVIFARTSKALVRLNLMLKERTIKKTYWAIVDKRPPTEQGTLVHYLRKNNEKNRSHVHDKQVKDSKKSVLHYNLLSAVSKASLLEVELETGRHHQIRAQLSRINCPIRGDKKYGAAHANKDGSISLHARKLEFIHPVSKMPITIVATVPNDALWRTFEHNITK